LTALVGLSVGVTGIGGFLIPPILAGLFGLGAREAIVYSLAGFVLAGAYATLLHFRGGSFDRRLVLECSAGAIPGVILGRTVNLALPDAALRLILVAVLVYLSANVYLDAARRSGGRPGTGGNGDASNAAAFRNPSHRDGRIRSSGFIFGLGCLTGFLGVMTGVGGGLILVPVLVRRGVEALPAVGVGIAVSVVVSAWSTVAIWPHVAVDGRLLGVIAFSQLLGVAAGAHGVRLWLAGGGQAAEQARVNRRFRFVLAGVTLLSAAAIALPAFAGMG